MKSVKHPLYKTLLVTTVIVLLLIMYRVCSVYLTESEDYTINDFFEYNLLTPTIIQNAPNVKNSVIIRYRAKDGPAPQINELEYKGSDMIPALENYLLSLGYHLSDDPIYGKKWVNEVNKKWASLTEQDGATRLTFME